MDASEDLLLKPWTHFFRLYLTTYAETVELEELVNFVIEKRKKNFAAQRSFGMNLCGV